jgi:hypothetical protein
MGLVGLVEVEVEVSRAGRFSRVSRELALE